MYWIRAVRALSVRQMFYADKTVNQAFNAILFLYSQVLEIEMPTNINASRSKKPIRLPIVSKRQSSCKPPGSGVLSFSKYFRAAAGAAGGRSSRNKNYWYPVLKNHRFFAIIKYLLVTPSILFFCMADTIPASKRSDESGVWIMWVRFQPLLFKILR